MREHAQMQSHAEAYAVIADCRSPISLIRALARETFEIQMIGER